MNNRNKLNNSEYLDLNQVKLDQPLQETANLLEFFIISVGKHMGLSVKQVSNNSLTIP